MCPNGLLSWVVLVPFLVMVGATPGPSNAAEVGQLMSARVATAPTVDGRGDDNAWRRAQPLEIVVKRVLPPNLGASTHVRLRSVHTVTHVYFLADWDDETKDDSAHKPWVWNSAENAYEEGSDREDMFTLAFEHTGRFTADMLSGEEGVWDIWQWKATRTNPQGFAMDRTHRYARAKPPWKANPHTARDGRDVWIARPEDAGETVEIKRPAPTGHEGALVPQYLPGTPGGSAADVRAKGTWAAGRWTLEFARAMNTGHADDTAFDPRRSYKMAVAAHDRTGDMDKASGIIELIFSDAR
jgi:hypothetical protein